jgi:hypothetical protein
MTVSEAAPLWEDPRHVLLKQWSETFDVPLNEFRHQVKRASLQPVDINNGLHECLRRFLWQIVAYTT